MSAPDNNRTCELCMGNDFELLADIRRIKRTIVKCKTCGLVFVDPMNPSFLTLDFEDTQRREDKYNAMRRVAEDTGKHDEDIITQEAQIRTLHFNSRKSIIDRYMSRGKLLDVGCGRGFFLSNFKDSGMDYFGVEPRARISAEARQRVGKDRVFRGTLKEARFPHSHFDAVTMINLIEHLPCPREALQEVNRIMNNGAILLVETPNVGSFLPRVLSTRWHAFVEPEHHYFFSTKTLTAMLENAGFTVVGVDRGNKLFTVRYLLYRLSWYNKRISICLEAMLNWLDLLEKVVKIPQFDEMIVVARKAADPLTGLNAP